MKGCKYFLSRLSILTGILFIGSAYANVPNTNTNPTTFVGPTATVGYVGAVTPINPYYLLGEAGARHFRASGTLGFAIQNYNRLKISAEYLTQDIEYSFFSGNSRQWVNQVALGAAYQQDLDMQYSPQFDLSAYFSHAPSKSLSMISGTYTNTTGTAINFTDNRRIAGSNADGGAIGFSIRPWQTAKTGIYLNYDSVRYDQIYNGINENADGFGGTAFYNQDLTDHITMGLTGAVRQPFNNYQVNLTWKDLYYKGRWSVGAFGEYNDGKNTLPNTWNAGINLNYFADSAGIVTVNDVKSEVSYKNEAPVQSPSNNYLMSWISDPAVHMPQVLAIADESVTTNQACTTPILTSTIPDVELLADEPIDITIPIASYFSGANLTFALVGAPTGASINSMTGVITFVSGPFSEGGTIPFVVTASNACGVAQGAFDIDIESPPFKPLKARG